mmetsp:Transcript_8179/g.13228  ORF Transcript_8179/g.13228 Transcript_8179/m.13228 type:complete len:89 (-) Transcript_8179:1121-1387(-)
MSDFYPHHVSPSAAAKPSCRTRFSNFLVGTDGFPLFLAGVRGFGACLGSRGFLARIEGVFDVCRPAAPCSEEFPVAATSPDTSVVRFL